MKKHFI